MIILCLSNESLCIISVIIVSLLLLSLYILNNIYNISNKYLKYIFYLYIILLIISSANYLTSGYANGENAHYQFANLYHSLSTIDFKGFFCNFYRVVIKENYISILTLIILLFSIIRNKDNKQSYIEVLCFSASVFIGFILLFLFTSVLFNPTLIGYNFQYLLDYPPLKTYYFRTLIILILFLSGYLYKKISKNQQKILTVALVCVLYFIFFRDINSFINEYEIQQEIFDAREDIYISDKISLLYNEYDGIALLPISYYNKYFEYLSLYKPVVYDSMPQIKERMNNITQNELNQGQSRLFLFVNNYEADNDYMNYLYNSYNVKLKGLMFVDDNIALEEFKKLGGKISTEELKKLNLLI